MTAETTRFSTLEIGSQFVDSMGTKWMKTENVHWLGTNNFPFRRNAVILESSHPKLRAGYMGLFTLNDEVVVLVPTEARSAS